MYATLPLNSAMEFKCGLSSLGREKHTQVKQVLFFDFLHNLGCDKYAKSQLPKGTLERHPASHPHHVTGTMPTPSLPFPPISSQRTPSGSLLPASHVSVWVSVNISSYGTPRGAQSEGLRGLPKLLTLVWIRVAIASVSTCWLPQCPLTLHHALLNLNLMPFPPLADRTSGLIHVGQLWLLLAWKSRCSVQKAHVAIHSWHRWHS